MQEITPSGQTDIEKSSGQRVFYYDVLRVLATLAIVMIHACSLKWYDLDVMGGDWFWLTCWESAARWGVPIFVMISGALFLDPAREVKTKTLYRKNILRMVAAFLFWSAVYTVYTVLISDTPVAFATAFMLFVQGEFHLWFLFMIAGLYMIVPLVRKITQSESATKYFLLLALIFTFLLPTARKVYQDAFPALLGKANSMTADLFFGVVDKLEFRFTLQYVAYFVLGFYLSKAEWKRGLRITAYALGVCGFAFNAVFSIIMARATRAPYGFFDDITVSTLLESVAVFVLVKHLAKAEYTGRLGRVIRFVSGRCFGVYLVHVLVIYVLNAGLHVSVLSLPPVISPPLLALGVFGLSLLLSAGLRKIPGVGKYIA